VNSSESIQSQSAQAETKHGAVLLLAAVMPTMAIASLVPALPLLMREFGDVAGSEFLVPMALTIPALCVAIFSPLAGWISDRIGRRNLLVVALLLYAVTGVLPWFLDSLLQILAARVALGICEAAIMTVSTALLGDYFEGARRERWIAMQVAVVSVAAIVLIALGGGMAELLGSRGPFLLYVLAVPAAIASALVLFEPARHTRAADAFSAPFPYLAVLPLVLITIPVGIVFYTVIVQFGPILELSGEVSPGLIGLIGAGGNIGVGAGTLLFERLKHRTGPGLLSLGLLIAGLGYFGAGLSTDLGMIAAFAIIACIGSGILLPNMLTWTMRRLPADMRGRGTGMWTGAFFLGQFVAPLVATASLGITGGLGNTLLVYAALTAVGGVAAAVVSARSSNRAGVRYGAQ